MRAIAGAVLLSRTGACALHHVWEHDPALDLPLHFKALYPFDPSTDPLDVAILRPLYCPSANEYSSMGQLFLRPLSESLKLLFHLGETLPAGQFAFDSSTAAVFGSVVFALMTCTYGTPPLRGSRTMTIARQIRVVAQNVAVVWDCSQTRVTLSSSPCPTILPSMLMKRTYFAKHAKLVYPSLLEYDDFILTICDVLLHLHFRTRLSQ